jgi:predicted enzyme related to lactoylglutathione lyase
MAGHTFSATPTIWNELAAGNSQSANGFYSSLLGWKTTDVDMGPMGQYTMFQQTSANVGGIVRMKSAGWEDLPPHWSVYIQVEDVDDSARRVEELGGSVCVAPFDIPRVGRACVAVDPEGASFYLFAPQRV